MRRNLSYCRESKANDIEKSNEIFVKKDRLSSESYENATILPAKKNDNSLKWGCGGVLDAEGNYIRLSAQPQRIDFGYPCSNAKCCEKTAVYCGYLSDHWGHFLLDCTARLWYCLKNASVDEYVFIGYENSGQNKLIGNFREFFRLLGMLDKIRIISTPMQYRQVIVPEMSYFYRRYWSEEYLQPFDYIAGCAMSEMEKKSGNLPDKVFFSRSHFPKALATEPGLEMMDSYFENNGYSVYWPEEMTLSEMIQIIRNAKVCAFESGTTPHNMLFAGKEQKTIIIERQSVVNNYQCDVDVVRDLNVTYIDGHFTVYPVFAGGGPFYLAYNKYMQMFSNDYGYIAPNEYFLSERYKRSCLKKYMNAYRKDYGEKLGLEEWHLGYINAIFEGYMDSMKDLSCYLSGEKIYSYMQLLHPSVLKIQLSIIKRRIAERLGVEK